MYNNGVSHSTVSWDYEGIGVILKWLSYFPATRSSPLPILLNPRDDIEREVGFVPTKTSYDPRNMLHGVNTSKLLVFVTLGYKIFILCWVKVVAVHPECLLNGL